MRSLFFAVLLAHTMSVPISNALPLSRVTKPGGLREVVRTLNLKLPQVRGKISAVVRTSLNLIVAGTVICSSLAMTGCERTRSMLDVTDTEYADPSGENTGQLVTVFVEGHPDEVYWEATPEGQVLLELDTGYSRVTFYELSIGQRISNHTNVGVNVVVQSQGDSSKVDRYGKVFEVYDSGFYIINIYEVITSYTYQSSIFSAKVEETLLVNPNSLPEGIDIEFIDN